MLAALQNFLILVVIATTVAVLFWQMIRPRKQADEKATEGEEESSEETSD